ncbi:putative Alpha/Beta hydrolase protein [Seiridium cardinale]|uniref:Alpha/Beta hydrolase protein n=1 Tax=Seiridium cardinale TaxID=138064 RepID=A0ABR2Y8G0_9PEZI
MASDIAPIQASPETVLIPWRNAPLTVELRKGEPTTAGGPIPFIVFVNGLGSSRASWAETLRRLPRHYTLLTYDRFGQGDTPPLPDDVPEELRDGTAAARDLFELIQELAKKGRIDLSHSKTVLAAHSIGAAIARLLLINHSIGAVGGALLLDPSIVNSDFVSLFPEPDDDEPEELTRTRDATRRVFHPSVPNPERFNRKNFAELLPFAEKPVLETDPYVTVVAHDPTVAFGEASEKMGITTKYARQYIEPYWQDYNKKLLLAVSEGKRKGPVVAERADHFIQKDRPDVVADEIKYLVDRVTPTT